MFFDIYLIVQSIMLGSYSHVNVHQKAYNSQAVHRWMHHLLLSFSRVIVMQNHCFVTLKSKSKVT